MKNPIKAIIETAKKNAADKASAAQAAAARTARLDNMFEKG
jgi:hypothetical protein